MYYESLLLLLPLYTATHGTGINVGNLATLVTTLKFVSGTGEVKSTNVIMH